MPSETPQPGQDVARRARSPLMMDVNDTALLIVDVQERLFGHIAGNAPLLNRIGLLARSADILGVPIVVTEQYRKGLGPTVAELQEVAHEPIEKMTFSAAIDEKVRERLDRPEIRKVLLTGIEAHVCVGQTALDLLAQGYRVYIACDAVGSRRSIDRDVALRRLENAGVVVTTAEAAVFEWLMVAGTDDFRQVSALVKEPIPQET